MRKSIPLYFQKATCTASCLFYIHRLLIHGGVCDTLVQLREGFWIYKVSSWNYLPALSTVSATTVRTVSAELSALIGGPGQCIAGTSPPTDLLASDQETAFIPPSGMDGLAAYSISSSSGDLSASASLCTSVTISRTVYDKAKQTRLSKPALLSLRVCLASIIKLFTY